MKKPPLSRKWINSLPPEQMQKGEQMLGCETNRGCLSPLWTISFPFYDGANEGDAVLEGGNG